MKYLRIIEEFKKSGKTYKDETYVASNDILNEEMANEVKEWKRPPQTATLFKDSISPMDIR